MKRRSDSGRKSQTRRYRRSCEKLRMAKTGLRIAAGVLHGSAATQLVCSIKQPIGPLTGERPIRDPQSEIRYPKSAILVP